MQLLGYHQVVLLVAALEARLLIGEGRVRELRVVGGEREVTERVHKLLVDSLAAEAERLAPLRTGERVPRHDVLDAEVSPEKSSGPFVCQLFSSVVSR